MTDRSELIRLITGGLGNGITTDDFRKARSGDTSIGEYIAEAILAAGYRKNDQQ